MKHSNIKLPSIDLVVEGSVMQKPPVTRREHHGSTLAQTLSQALVHVRRGAAIAELAIDGSDPAIGVVFLLDELAKAERILDAYTKRKR